MHKPVLLAACDAKVVKALKILAEGLSVEVVKLDSPMLDSKEKILQQKVQIIFACEEDIIAFHAIFPKEERPIFVTLFAESEQKLPLAYVDGICDDIILYPFLRPDFLSRLSWYIAWVEIRKIQELNSYVSAISTAIDADIVLAEKIQRRLIKQKFPAVPGIKISSKYWCGLKRGGDYFDCFTFRDHKAMGVFMADSSSYRLSANLLNALIDSSKKFSRYGANDPAGLLAEIHKNIFNEMRDDDQLSLFYGVIDRKTYDFSFANYGSISLMKVIPQDAVQIISQDQHECITKKKIDFYADTATINPGERILLYSDGIRGNINEPKLQEIIKTYSTIEPQRMINEMAYFLRKHAAVESKIDDEGFPYLQEDCSLLVFDIDKKILRLAK